MNRFPRVPAVRPGYDPDEVDALIKRIEATLGKGVLESEPVTADELRAARFTVRLGGYNEIAVDYALEAFIIAVENKDVPPRRAGEPEAGDAPAAGADATSSAVRPPEQPPPEPPSATGPGPAADSPIPDTAARAVPGDPGERDGAARDRAPVAEPPWPTPPAEAVPPPGAADAADRDAATEPPEPGAQRPENGPENERLGAERPAPGRPDTGRPAAEAEDAPRRPAEQAGGPLDEWLEAQAVRVERASFRSGRLGMGYSEEEVDAFLDRVVATLRRTTDEPLTAADVREARFSTVLFRPGYAIGEVDEFLADIAEVLERRDDG